MAARGPRSSRSVDGTWVIWSGTGWSSTGTSQALAAPSGATKTSTTLSLETLVDDGVALVKLLAADYGDRPLVLVGHSFGTVLGVRIAERAAEHVSAYVGAAQVVNWALQEERSYDWALQEARRTGNRKAQTALDQIGRPVAGQYASGTSGVKTQRRWLGTLGGVAADPRFVPRWAVSVFTSRGYPLSAKLRYLKAMDRSMDLLWPHLCEEIDFRREVVALQVPVYLFAGRQDRITDLAQIQEWFATLESPGQAAEGRRRRRAPQPLRRARAIHRLHGCRARESHLKMVAWACSRPPRRVVEDAKSQRASRRTGRDGRTRATVQPCAKR